MWADKTYMTTMTGQLGLSDNSTPAWTYYTKTATIKAGETYTYTFQNFTKGSSATAEYQTWIAEIREETSGYCLDARGDGGGWIWDGNPTTNTLAYNYTGKAWNEGGRSLSDFMTAYNNVTVTLTISCSNDGKVVTVARTATLNGDTDFSGTWTCSNFAGNDKTINLIVEASHLNITKVSYTNASGVVTNYELKNVDLSNFDSYFNGSYSDGVATFTKEGNSTQWAKLPLSSYFSGITGTVTNVNMKFTENMNNGGRMTIGIYGNDKTSWATNAWQDTGDAVSAWGLTGKNDATRIYYSSTYTTGVTLGSATEIEVDMDVVSRKFTWIQGGTTKVNNQSCCSGDVSIPQYFALYSWSGTNTTTISNMSMEIVYVEASYYTATFTNTTSSNTPTVTIYTDSERTSEIANGLLENGNTYYFTAVEEGYQNYNGSFTVSGADPAVNFAMTAKTVYNYTVNAVDGEDHIIKANIASGSCYANEEKSFYIPACVLVDGVLYFTADASYSKTETVSSNNQVFPYAYTTSTVNNVKYFFEGESLNVHGTSGSSSTGTKSSESNGDSRRPLANSYLYTPALAGGNYTVYIRVFGNNAKSENLAIYYCDADGGNPVSLGVNTASSTASSYTTVSNANIAIPDGKCLAFNRGADNSNFVIDYIYLIATESVTVTSAGYATYVSANNLDFTSTGIKAYTAKVNGASKSVVMTQINKVPAGTPVILYKEGGATENVPVATTTDTPAENDLIAGTGAAVATDGGDGKINYILNNVSGIGFYKANGQTVAANRAYLQTTVDAAAARMTMIFEDDDVTSISEELRVKSEEFAPAAEFYDLQGRKVAQPQKGLYIVNGKKVVLK